MKTADFAAFFAALHGVDPFPWQTRLAKQVCDSGVWPKVVDLPTGAGKTACIDIALFHLLVASAAGRTGEGARRIAFVVDRRIIVDEAASRARRIADAIATATNGILAEAAREIERLSGQSRIDVMTLRGGAQREKNLVRDPTTVAVVLSTVDQLGSRLLFRGYGVTDYAKPMHAGLFGFDTLLFLDEAHIAEPFRQTLAGVVREQARAAVRHRGTKALQWCQLSATPATTPDFSIDGEDERHPTLRRRLQARKPTALLEVQKRDELPKKIAELVKAELLQPPQSEVESSRIGIVVNRVSSARDIHSALLRTLKDGVELHLLIGRIRPIDRDRLMTEITPRLKSSGEPRPGDRPIVVVATQTIEVGADFDFHTMFVEAASYPAVRQRLGRLNRLGVRDSARAALILVRADAEDDPVYRSTIARTWNVLEQSSRDRTVDLGIRYAPAPAEGTAPPSPPTPELSPALLRLLAQTSPRPAIEPDVGHLLHGFVEQAADVAVVWRDGISNGSDAIDAKVALLILDALPPLTSEAMSVPLHGLRAWLRTRTAKKQGKVVDGGDVEGDLVVDDHEDSDVRVLAVRDDSVDLIGLDEVRPGSTIVVPCEWGGSDAFGFAPESKAPVADLSLIARTRGERAPTIVFTPALARSWANSSVDPQTRNELIEDAARLARSLSSDDAAPVEVRTAFFTWVDAHRELLRRDVLDVVEKLRALRSSVETLDLPDQTRAFVLRASRPRAGDLSDDDVGLQRTVEVGLEEHSKGVADYAERFARAVGLDEPMVSDLRLAGRLHDLGKADPRFQAMLGGDGVRLLAKGSSFDQRVVLGARHECYSVSLLDRYPALVAGAADAELVRYLVGTHHGRGRGLQPVVDDVGASFSLDVDGKRLEYRGRAELGAIDSGWADSFGRLQRRYGAWGLAYLETLLRLADHRRSEAEIEEAKP